MVSNWFRNLAVKRKIALLVGFFSLVLLVMLVLAVKDVQGADRRRGLFDIFDLQGEAFGEKDPLAQDPARQCIELFVFQGRQVARDDFCRAAVDLGV